MSHITGFEVKHQGISSIKKRWNPLNQIKMRKSIITIFLFSMMCSSSIAQSKFHFGARAGNNIANGTWIKSFNIGAIAEYDISSLSDIFCLESGLVLNWKGLEKTYRDAYGITKLIYLEVPINALYNVNFDASELQFFGGPFLGYIVAGNSSVGIKPFDFGLNIGTGIRMEDIHIRFQYGYGLRNLDTGVSSKSRAISISIGFMFGRE